MKAANKNLKWTVLASFILLLQTACVQTVILYKPRPQLDPMPNRDKIVEESKPDPLFSQQWNLAKVGATADGIKGLDFQGNYNVTVALLSTGVDYNHDDLRGQVAVNTAEITQLGRGDKEGVNQKDDDNDKLVDNVVGYDVIDGDGFAYDRHGAGTAVAGIIAARQNNGIGIAGLARNVTIYPIRYINDNGQSSVAALAAALDIAANRKPHVIYIQSVELEVGGYSGDPQIVDVELKLIGNLLNKIRDAKIPVIIGAGDDLGTFGSSHLQKLFKRYENVIVVTSLDKNDQLPLLANTDFEGVTTMAPGEDILTLQPLNKYGTVHGTAYAAAHVTAAYVLAKAQFGDRLEIKDFVAALVSAKGSDSLPPGMERFSRGGNRLNIQKLLAELRTR